jgi:hypothetical protein
LQQEKKIFNSQKVISKYIYRGVIISLANSSSETYLDFNVSKNLRQDVWLILKSICQDTDDENFKENK